MENQEVQNILTAFANGESLRIAAGAGAGKSTTLRKLAKSAPSKEILCICFNKANADESMSHPDKPNNIHYSTIHAIAYNYFFRELKYPTTKLGKFLDYKNVPDTTSVVDKISMPMKDFDRQKMANTIIRESLTKFCQSADTLDNLSKSVTVVLEAYKEYFDSDITDIVTPIVKNYWFNLIDKNKVLITPDIYLKVFQLNGGSLNTYKGINIDAVFLDEAQDTNPVVEAIFNTQDIQRVIVGDANQQLYLWRGAGDTLNNFPGFTNLTLSETYRSAQPVVDIANKVLSFGAELRLRTNVPMGELVTKAYLGRTNAACLTLAAEFLKAGLDFGIKFDVKDTFSKLWHLNSVIFNKMPKYPDKDLKNITNARELELAESVNPDIKIYKNLLMNLLGIYGNLFDAQEALTELTTKNYKRVVISTIHSAKGLEWDEVVILNDFFAGISDSEEALSEEDIINKLKDDVDSCRCMLYVAVTRAKYKVSLPNYLSKIIL